MQVRRFMIKYHTIGEKYRGVSQKLSQEHTEDKTKQESRAEIHKAQIQMSIFLPAIEGNPCTV